MTSGVAGDSIRRESDEILFYIKKNRLWQRGVRKGGLNGIRRGGRGLKGVHHDLPAALTSP
jgi:hypothetical protein